MFSTVQQKFTSALSYFGYGSELSKGLPEKIYKTLENQDFTAETRLHEHRITSKPPSFWQKVASLGMSYLFFSSGQSSLQETLSSGVGGIGFTALSLHASEPWALPLTFVAGLSIFPDMALAQSTFIEAIGGADTDLIDALMATPEGNIIATGNTNSFGAGFYDLLLSKFSSNGMLIWANTLGGAINDGGQAVTSTSEGDLIVAGNTASFGAGNFDLLLTKFSSNGTLLWSKTFGGVGEERDYSLLATTEGDLVVAGNTNSFQAGGSAVLLCKFSSNGTLLWVNTFDGANSDSSQALTSTSEGDLFVAGYTNSFGVGNFDVLLSKFSSNGTLLWAKTYGGVQTDYGQALTATPEGNIVITGYTNSFGVGSEDVQLSKFSSNGALIWANTIGGVGSDIGRALIATSEGDLIISGVTSSFGAGSEDVLLFKFSSNGTLVWANTLGGLGSDSSFALTATVEGNIIIAGRTVSFGTGSDDVLLAKLNAQGSIENCSAWQSITPQVQSITPNVTDVTQNMTISIPPWTVQDATSALNVTDITNLLNQTTECYAQTLVNQTSTSSSSSSLLSSPVASSSSHSQGSVLFTSSAFSSTPLRQTSSSPSSPILSSDSLQKTSDVSEPSTNGGATIPSITTFVYGESYSIIVNGETIGTFYFTGGSGQLDSNNTNTLNIQLNGDIEDGETIILFTIPEGEEPLWEDIILSDESESGCITKEGVFTTTSEEEHSYQLIFEYESSECSQSTATLKLAAIPVLGGGIL